LTSPPENAARLRSRAFCERLPCRSTAGMPDAVSCFASFFAWCLVRHGGDVRVGLVDRVQDRVVEELLDELVHAVVERGGEEEALPARRRGVHDARDDGQEAQVGHVVRLVEHGDLDGVEVHDALLHEVVEASGAGHDDVDAVAERGLLRALRDAAEDGGHGEACGLGERLDDRCDLGCELAGREQHEAERPARAALATGHGTGEAGHERDRERERLAGACLATAEDIAACEGALEGGLLDGERFVLACCIEHAHERLGDAELGES
jgi:hypothetical protein